MRSLKQFLSIAVIAAFPAGCGDRAGSPQSQGSAEKPAVAPKQYSVADFHKNVEVSGASWSADKQRILVSSNQSGIGMRTRCPRVAIRCR
jgi:hypothetical protein